MGESVLGIRKSNQNDEPKIKKWTFLISFIRSDEIMSSIDLMTEILTKFGILNIFAKNLQQENFKFSVNWCEI